MLTRSSAGERSAWPGEGRSMAARQVKVVNLGKLVIGSTC
jgi:hypothetical protein